MAAETVRDSIEVAIQAVLHLASGMSVEPGVKYAALMALADRFLPTATISLQNVPTGFSGSSNAGDCTVVVLAGAALYFSWKSIQGVESDDEKRAIEFLSNVRGLCCVSERLLGFNRIIDRQTSCCSVQTVTSCRLCLSGSEHPLPKAKDFVRAAELLRREVGNSHFSRRLVSDHIQEFHSKAREAGIKAYKQRVRISDCLLLLDALYANAKFRGALENGGKLLASGIVTAAYCIFVPQAEVVVLPFCAWLADVSGHPKEVIRAQAECILVTVLVDE